MQTTYNETFRQLLSEYKLSEDLYFSVEIPTEIQSILDDQIVISELGVSLKSLNKLYKPTEEWENQSIIEDNENHFHVDWYFDPSNSKKAFMLGVKTLMLLAEKFQDETIKGIRFWYNFQTPGLGEKWAKHHQIDEEDDEHFISDRLSFYKRRPDEPIISIDDNDEFSAILIIDI